MLYRPLAVLAAGGLSGLLALSGTAHAQRVEAGLWELNAQIHMPGNPQLEKQMAMVQEQLKNLPPEARKQMESRFNIGLVGGDPRRVRMCVTPEQAAQAFAKPPDDECTYRETGRSGNTLRGQVMCPSSGMQGEFTTTIHSPTHYTMVAQLSSPQGRMDIRTEGRHVGQDCGDLKGGPGGPAR